MRVLVALSGGVDSSVAAALLLAQGHDVVGVTMKLWGGESDSGCCSVADVEDARRVAQQLGVDHWVFNFSEDFDRTVVSGYVSAHREGRTPNPCIECNRHLKFDRLLRRALQLGFDAVATGHHARVEERDGRFRLRRGADAGKDQSYVLYMLGQDQLSRCLFPVGAMEKSEVRRRASELGLRTADKPDSQDVCFVTATGGRTAFLAPRLSLRPGRVIDGEGVEVGAVDAVELVTVGQRRGLGVAGGRRRYVLDVDVARAIVRVGDLDEVPVPELSLAQVCWVDRPVEGPVLVQCGAHGRPRPAILERGGTRVRFERPEPRVAPGQSVVSYVGDEVVGGGVVVAGAGVG
ncbi:MAG: tRNA 2-thiouridine(34) synthase MnmA [Acidimicrobiales bacterium]